MKQVTRLFVCIIFILSSQISTSLFAQNEDLDIVLIGDNSSGNVNLRIAPLRTEVFIEGQISGYTIERKTYANSNGNLTTSQMENSSVVLVNNLMPWTEQEFDAFNFINPDLGHAAKMLLYSGEFDVSYNPSTLNEAIEIENLPKNKYIFSMFLADRGFDISTSLGLGYTDLNARTDEAYIYIVSINVGGNMLKSLLKFDNREIALPEPISSLKAESGVNSAQLSWNTKSVQKFYTAYHIERSIDNITFTRITDIPFTYTGGEHSPDEMHFIDTIPPNTDYYYRILGVTPFATLGEVSESVVVQAQPPKMQMSFRAIIQSETPYKVIVAWGGIKAEQEARVGGFDVYRSTNIDQDYIKLNGSLLDKAKKKFNDTSPLAEAYYMVVMTDTDGNQYKSNAVLSQPTDTIPPAAPTSLLAQVEDDGTVSIDWADNSEEDLEGYRLYQSNLENGEYIDVTQANIFYSSYVDKLDLNNLTEKVYYKVLATDLRGNYSEFSNIVELIRPDNIAPPSALISNLMPSDEGIKVAWVLSDEIDIEQYTLSRRRSDQQNWVEVVSFTPQDELVSQEFGQGDFRYNYIDESELDLVPFTYRMETRDLFGNTSASNEISITPQAKMIKERPYELEASYTCDPELIAKIEELIVGYQQTLTTINNYNSGNTGGQSINQVLTGLLNTGTITFNQYYQVSNQNAIPNSNGQSGQTNFINAQIAALNADKEEVICLLTLDFKFDLNIAGVRGYDIYRGTDLNNLQLLDMVNGSRVIHTLPNTFTYLDQNVPAGETYYYKVMAKLTNSQYSNLSRPISIYIKAED